MLKRAGIVGNLLLLASHIAWADPCHLEIESTDQMQFTKRQLIVPASCSDIEITLTHIGTLPAKVMGHTWVLAKTADVRAIASAAIAAGYANNFQPLGDQRIIAATKIVGGGESVTIRFSSAALRPGGDYMFFCSVPGHASNMKGKFIFGEPPERVASSP